ncbi:MAG TPA: hypothetical protein PLA68_18340 [Panacibacter sp.]|nr:hypothetical protein [Panacibacter sp.]
MSFIIKKMWVFFVPNCINAIEILLRRTLVLLQETAAFTKAQIEA